MDDSKLTESSINMIGGEIEDEAEEISIPDFKVPEDSEVEEVMEMELESEEYEDIEQIYKNIDVLPDEHGHKTAKMIEDALDEGDLVASKNKLAVDFDYSKDKDVYDDNLKDVYNKYFVSWILYF